jgi:hypothetical protein
LEYGGILAWVHWSSMNYILDDMVVFREAFRLPAAECGGYFECACGGYEDLCRKIEA